MSLTFRIYRGEQLLREETLAQPVIKIGKVASAHLRLEDDSISRMHAIIEVARDSISVIDLGSAQAAVGDAVELLGPHALLDDLAAAAGTVAHEVLVRLSARAERLYLGRA